MASYDVIFLGGGPAGYVGAIRAAQLGLAVAVVEREGLGGTCVLWGCIPAKALLESAYLADKMHHAADHGITTGPVTFDFGPAMKRSRAISTQNSKGVEFLFKKNKITWIKGTGTLVSPPISLGHQRPMGSRRPTRRSRGIIISTGSRVRGLPTAGLPLDRRTVLSSDDVLVLEHAPKSMLDRRRRRGRVRVRGCLQFLRDEGHADRHRARSSCRSRMPTSRRSSRGRSRSERSTS